MSITDNCDPFNAFVPNTSINILKKNYFEWETLIYFNIYIFFKDFDEKLWNIMLNIIN